jgi:hypothetical protein
MLELDGAAQIIVQGVRLARAVLCVRRCRGTDQQMLISIFDFVVDVDPEPSLAGSRIQGHGGLAT